MAHLGEAQAIIELFQLKRLTPHYYEGDLIGCLITGEGPFEAVTQTAAILGQKKFTKVINFGIAGTLNSNHEVGSICEIRSIYLIIEGKPQFKSFSPSSTGVDCITSFERILSHEKAKILQGVGDIVDREAWGVAMAAKTLGVEFECYKLISDQAGTLGACEVVRDMAQEWSLKLAQFLAYKLKNTQIVGAVLDLEGFYFTFTMRHQFESMVTKLSLREEVSKEEILNSLPMNDLREQKQLPKERAQKLIQILEERLDPLKKELSIGLERWKKPFESKGIHLATDPIWEDPKVKITLQAANQDELEEKINTLSLLKLAPFINLRHGKLDVE
jgi:hypothetical protein